MMMMTDDGGLFSKYPNNECKQRALMQFIHGNKLGKKTPPMNADDADYCCCRQPMPAGGLFADKPTR